jgi:hypothetical protein
MFTHKKTSPLLTFTWNNSDNKGHYYKNNNSTDYCKEKYFILMNYVSNEFDKQYSLILKNKNSKITNIIVPIRYNYKKEESGKYLDYAEYICNNISIYINKYSKIHETFFIKSVKVEIIKPIKLDSSLLNYFYYLFNEEIVVISVTIFIVIL